MTRDAYRDLITLPAVPVSVPHARHCVVKVLGVDHAVLGDVELLVSELVTNGVAHSDSRLGGCIALALQIEHGRVRIEVTDGGRAATRPHIRRGGLDAEHGRGLVLVDAIAARWGVHELAFGVMTWCEVEF